MEPRGCAVLCGTEPVPGMPLWVLGGGVAALPAPFAGQRLPGDGETEAAVRSGGRACRHRHEGDVAEVGRSFLCPPAPAVGGSGRCPVVTRCSLLPQLLPCWPCRPPTRRPSASGRAGASGRAEVSGRTAASARAASPRAPPGTPCHGICPCTSRRSGRARTRCWTRPRGLSSELQVTQRPGWGLPAVVEVAAAAGPVPHKHSTGCPRLGLRGAGENVAGVTLLPCGQAVSCHRLLVGMAWGGWKGVGCACAQRLGMVLTSEGGGS